MRVISLIAIVCVPWVMAFVAPGYIRMVNEPVRQTYALTGGELFSCSINTYDYFLRTLLISAPISITCVLALVIWAYFLSSRENERLAREQYNRNYIANSVGIKAVREAMKLDDSTRHGGN